MTEPPVLDPANIPAEHCYFKSCTGDRASSGTCSPAIKVNQTWSFSSGFDITILTYSEVIRHRPSYTVPARTILLSGLSQISSGLQISHFLFSIEDSGVGGVFA